MFFSSKLKKFENLRHCFFSRKDGVSKGSYNSLNCGLGSDDKRENVLKNLELVSNRIGCKKEFLITLNQKHSNRVIYLNDKKNLKNKLIGDALVTNIKNIGISILTADCAPIIFYDPIKKIIGCAHAGWKGALNGIIENTIKKFEELNSKSKDIIAVIGPCIGKNNYEVKEDFIIKFIEKNEKNKKFFYKKNDKQFTFDLRGFINQEIFNLNIKNIENIEMDTFSEDKLFFSYRRSRISNEKDYGRCISVILMT
tara:strand:+ start:284 stop:1045 length:762 start_codon:yes stop_codon:yes gene_type:complete